MDGIIIEFLNEKKSTTYSVLITVHLHTETIYTKLQKPNDLRQSTLFTSGEMSLQPPFLFPHIRGERKILL